MTKKKQDNGEGCALIVVMIIALPFAIFLGWLLDGIIWGVLFMLIILGVASTPIR